MAARDAADAATCGTQQDADKLGADAANAPADAQASICVARDR